MTYQISDYKGDAEFNINCTGDCVVGDEVRFERAEFTGSFRNAKFAGFEQITGKIIADSYGYEKQQHTFTIEQDSGSITLIKGRNLYANGLYRKPWKNEALRDELSDEKHTRGNCARVARDIRKVEFNASFK